MTGRISAQATPCPHDDPDAGRAPKQRRHNEDLHLNVLDGPRQITTLLSASGTPLTSPGSYSPALTGWPGSERG